MMDGRKQSEECQNIEQGIKNLLFSPPQQNHRTAYQPVPLRPQQQNDQYNNNNTRFQIPRDNRQPNRNRPVNITQLSSGNRGRGIRTPTQIVPTSPQHLVAGIQQQHHQQATSPPQQAAPPPNWGNREYHNQSLTKPPQPVPSGNRNQRRPPKNRAFQNERQELFTSQSSSQSSDQLLSRMNNYDNDPMGLREPEKVYFKPADLSRQQATYLKESHIEALQKPLPKDTDARFACQLCQQTFRYYDKVKLHVKSQNHTKRMKEETFKTELNMLTFPSDEHLRGLTIYLEGMFRQEGLSRREQQLRQECLGVLQSLFECESQLSSCQVRPFDLAPGSVLRGPQASYDLVLQKGHNPAIKLNQISELLKRRKDIFKDVSTDLFSKHPCIMFHSIQQNLDCCLFLMSNPSYFLTHRLLKDYTNFNPLTETLATLFHLLAEVCELNLPDKGSLPQHAFPIMVVYFLQQYKPPLLPVLHNYAEQEGSYPDIEKAKSCWPALTSQPSLGELWVKLLKFYAVQFEYSEHVVAITTGQVLNMKDKQWFSRTMAIEEPFHSKRNLARTFSTQEVFSYFHENICYAYKYFAEARDSVNSFSWNFDRKNFNPTMTSLPIFCNACNRRGHLKDDCPEFKLPPLKHLEPLPSEYEDQLTEVCEKLFNDLEPSDVEKAYKTTLLNKLREYIRCIFPNAILELFGSSVNGFGFKNCDMDICMTFVDKKCEEMEQPQVQVQIIELLAQHLACNTDYERVIPITTAKVPIVKLKFSKTEMEADISLYNTLAKHNTELLKTYTHIDRRVQILGFVMKHFAKLFEIGDASSGSLSSYAYILMVIYFLQQRDPPVLPVLQELHPNPQRRPQRMVKEWDTWFFNDTSRLREMWPAGGKNKETIGQLLVQIFKFYTETFEFDKYVVSIRQRSPMTRLEKLWNSKCIVIEDPFDLSHNLGSGLSRKMDRFIKEAFIRGRTHFGTEVLPAQYQFRSLKNYLFNKDVLTCGLRPPMERCCHICRKIGHRARDCPRSHNSPIHSNKKFNVRSGMPPQGNNMEALLPTPHPILNLQPQRGPPTGTYRHAAEHLRQIMHNNSMMLAPHNRIPPQRLGQLPHTNHLNSYQPHTPYQQTFYFNHR